MAAAANVYAPGARIVVRDAEWLIRRVDRTSSGGEALYVVGISELVRAMHAMFLTEMDRHIQVLDPVDTMLVPDDSPGFQPPCSTWKAPCARRRRPMSISTWSTGASWIWFPTNSSLRCRR